MRWSLLLASLWKFQNRVRRIVVSQFALRCKLTPRINYVHRRLIATRIHTWRQVMGSGGDDVLRYSGSPRV